MNWDDQISLFELAESRYGLVDVVVRKHLAILHIEYQIKFLMQVPIAGVTELGSFTTPRLINGKLIRPLFKTLEINLVGVMYSQ
jgi:hypothetical protein